MRQEVYTCDCCEKTYDPVTSIGTDRLQQFKCYNIKVIETQYGFLSNHEFEKEIDLCNKCLKKFLGVI